MASSRNKYLKWDKTILATWRSPTGSARTSIATESESSGQQKDSTDAADQQAAQAKPPSEVSGPSPPPLSLKCPSSSLSSEGHLPTKLRKTSAEGAQELDSGSTLEPHVLDLSEQLSAAMSGREVTEPSEPTLIRHGTPAEQSGATPAFRKELPEQHGSKQTQADVGVVEASSLGFQQIVLLYPRPGDLPVQHLPQKGQQLMRILPFNGLRSLQF